MGAFEHVRDTVESEASSTLTRRWGLVVPSACPSTTIRTEESDGRAACAVRLDRVPEWPRHRSALLLTGAAEIQADQVDELSAIAGRVSTDDDLAAALTAFAAAIGFDLVSIIEATDPDTQARSVTVGFHPRPQGEPA